MVYLAPELRLLINDFAPSKIISDNRAYQEIKKLYRNFSLEYLHHRFSQWKIKLNDAIDELVRYGYTVQEFDTIYENMRDIKFSIWTFYTGNHGNIHLLDTSHIRHFGLESKVAEMHSDGYYFMYKDDWSVLKLNLLIKYFEALDSRPFDTNVIRFYMDYGEHIYSHRPEPKHEESGFQQEWLDKIVTLDPNFSIQNAYNLLKKKYERSMKLEQDIRDVLMKNYENITMLLYRDDSTIITSTVEIPEWRKYLWDIKGGYRYMFSYVSETDGYEKFIEMVACLDHGDNQTYLYSMENGDDLNYTTPIKNPYS